MKALKLEGCTVREIEIENTLEALQEAVYGYIETITLTPDRAVMIVNEEGRIRGMAVNPAATKYTGIVIVGPALIVGVDGEEFCDVPEEIIEQFRA
ncbi:MAG: DUF3846 domain-containing protein [Ruminococcus sp.]|nr:DUF3846 domain-containing protein [Ruminococcus sp.]